MKKLLALAALGAILSTATPAQAVAGRLRATFANIHNNRKPLTALGAFIGLGSTGYLAQQAMTKKNFDCNRHIAEITRATLEWRGDDTQYNLWMKERNKAFRYCRWTMPGTTRKELYETNIAYAQKRAQQYRAQAQWHSGALGFIDSLIGSKNMLVSQPYGYAHLYEKTAQQLKLDLKKEQEPKPDIVRELMALGLYN